MPRSVIEPEVRDRARKQRKSPTRGEKAMHEYLRSFRPYGARFRREAPIGPYVVDFAWLSARIVIEVDGASHDLPGRPVEDARRDRFLEGRGFRVFRVRDADVMANRREAFEAIEAAILSHLKVPGSRFDADLKGGRDPSPNPSPQGGGESGFADRQRLRPLNRRSK
ncbi:DUF559 domain-containing protein [Afifella sp. JA880]|uniref:endonuclease domain-containing protein n=1 Tax=Afifella sp. JA880 TaxID=2975280 RepID=UPI0021BA9628|nr:DUF559 domain-containing protein [Afifella sp. JA880]MCT8266706.1 DUF559 domain-containing protein [Afifella sp. JA880]